MKNNFHSTQYWFVMFSMPKSPLPTLSRLAWRPCKDGVIPPDAVAGGCLGPGHTTTYIGTVDMDQDGHIFGGTIVPTDGKCHVPKYGNEFLEAKYVILTNPNHVTLRWIPASSGQIPTGAVVGGRFAGTNFYVGRTTHQDNQGGTGGHLCIGNIFGPHGRIYYPFGGREESVKDYEVLVEVYNEDEDDDDDDVDSDDSSELDIVSMLKAVDFSNPLIEQQQASSVSADGRVTNNFFIGKVIHKN